MVSFPSPNKRLLIISILVPFYFVPAVLDGNDNQCRACLFCTFEIEWLVVARLWKELCGCTGISLGRTPLGQTLSPKTDDESRW